MKKIVRVISVGVFFAFFFIWICNFDITQSFDNLVKGLTGAGREIHIGTIYSFISVNALAFLFHVQMGNFVSEHFNGVGVYVFSRTKKRGKWYGRELVYILTASILYMLFLVVLAVGVTFCFDSKGLEMKHILILCVYVLTWGLYLFASTVLINVVSVLMGSSKGIFVVEILHLFLLSHLCMQITGFMEKESYQWEKVFVNPISFLHFGIHSCDVKDVDAFINTYGVENSLYLSPVIWGLISILVCIVGFFIIKNKQVMESGGEMEL